MNSEADRLTHEALNKRVDAYLALIQEAVTKYRTLTQESLSSGSNLVDINLDVERRLLEQLQYTASILSGIGQHFLNEGKVQATLLGLKGDPKSKLMAVASEGRVRAEEDMERVAAEINTIVGKAMDADAKEAEAPMTLPPLSNKPSGGLN